MTKYLLTLLLMLLGTEGDAGLFKQVTQKIDSVNRKFSKHETLMGLAEERLKGYFAKAEVAYPPKAVTLLFNKDTRLLTLYAGPQESQLKLIHNYEVLAASGVVGPKLRMGDEQVPEGIYRIVGLNPQSQFHLSLRVNYPNQWDTAHGKSDRRKNLGGDIMIHGNAVSIGCIAIGNVPIEEVYRLAEKTNFRKWKVLLTPVDFRTKKLSKEEIPKLSWIGELYQNIETELKKLP